MRLVQVAELRLELVAELKLVLGSGMGFIQKSILY